MHNHEHLLCTVSSTVTITLSIQMHPCGDKTPLASWQQLLLGITVVPRSTMGTTSLVHGTLCDRHLSCTVSSTLAIMLSRCIPVVTNPTAAIAWCGVCHDDIWNLVP